MLGCLARFRFLTRSPPGWAIELMAEVRSIRFMVRQLQEETMSVADDINARLDQTLEEVRIQTTEIDGINTLADGLRLQILELMKNTGVSQAVLTKVDTLFTALRAQGEKVHEVLVENTPPPPAPPVDVPPADPVPVEDPVPLPDGTPEDPIV